MCKIGNWKLAKKLEASNKRGLIIGITIGILACLVIAGIIAKLCCLKRKFECLHYDMDDFDCECDCECGYAGDACTCDCECNDGDSDSDSGCSFTSEKDFV